MAVTVTHALAPALPTLHCALVSLSRATGISPALLFFPLETPVGYDISRWAYDPALCTFCLGYIL